LGVAIVNSLSRVKVERADGEDPDGDQRRRRA
jgi:hypothetical protein